jgi:hypothetical protein
MRRIRSLPFLFLASLLIVGAAAPSALARPRGKQFAIPTPHSAPYHRRWPGWGHVVH